jgi:beta-lactam-binding protein with PASTA domain
MRRFLPVLVVVLMAVAALSLAFVKSSSAGPSSETTRVVVPNVVGMRMDRATRTLRNHGLRVNEECSGLFGCIVKSRWWVCRQSPRVGKSVRRYSVVVIYAERRGEC